MTRIAVLIYYLLCAKDFILSLFHVIVSTIYCSFTNDRNMLKGISQLFQSNRTNKYSNEVCHSPCVLYHYL